MRFRVSGIHCPVFVTLAYLQLTRSTEFRNNYKPMWGTVPAVSNKDGAPLGIDVTVCNHPNMTSSSEIDV